MTYLQRLRMVLAVAGLIFAIAGVATDNRIITWTAIGLLATSFLLRVFLKKRQENHN